MDLRKSKKIFIIYHAFLLKGPFEPDKMRAWLAAGYFSGKSIHDLCMLSNWLSSHHRLRIVNLTTMKHVTKETFVLAKALTVPSFHSAHISLFT